MTIYLHSSTSGGIVSISIDGGIPVDVDTYSDSAAKLIAWSTPVFPHGDHVINLVVTGAKNPRNAHAARVTIDRAEANLRAAGSEASARSQYDAGIGGKRNYVKNPSFEGGENKDRLPDGWLARGQHTRSFFSDDISSPHTGRFVASHWTSNSRLQVCSYQTLSGLPDGRYTLQAWVFSKVTSGSSRMFAKVSGGEKSLVVPAIPRWFPIVIRDIDVTGGDCQVGFETDASGGQLFFFDDVLLYKR
jgi:hypothetical protein